MAEGGRKSKTMIGLSKKLPPVSSFSVSKIAMGMYAELITRRLFFVRFLPSSLKIGGGTKERERKRLLCRSVFSSLLLLRLVSLKLMFRRRKFVKSGEGGESWMRVLLPPLSSFFSREGEEEEVRWRQVSSNFSPSSSFPPLWQ